MAMKAATERMDPDLFTTYCVDSPDFLFVSPFGNAYNYAQSQTMWKGLVTSFRSQTNTLAKTRVIVLSPDEALFFWQGTVSGTTRDGHVFTTVPYSGTNLFRRVGGTWKVVYIQESGLPAKKQEAPGSTDIAP